MPFDNTFSVKSADMPRYVAEIAQLKEEFKGQIDIYCALEAVEHQDRMTIFDLIIVDGELIEIKKRDKGKPLVGKDERTAIEFIEKYWKEIVEKWVSFFVYKKRVRCTDIKTKLK